MAERVLRQAVAYLITAMEEHDQKLELGCGPLIDISVHGFILDTASYRDQTSACRYSGVLGCCWNKASHGLTGG